MNPIVKMIGKIVGLMLAATGIFILGVAADARYARPQLTASDFSQIEAFLELRENLHEVTRSEGLTRVLITELNALDKSRERWLDPESYHEKRIKLLMGLANVEKEYGQSADRYNGLATMKEYQQFTDPSWFKAGPLREFTPKVLGTKDPHDFGPIGFKPLPKRFDLDEFRPILIPKTP